MSEQEPRVIATAVTESARTVGSWDFLSCLASPDRTHRRASTRDPWIPRHAPDRSGKVWVEVGPDDLVRGVWFAPDWDRRIGTSRAAEAIWEAYQLILLLTAETGTDPRRHAQPAASGRLRASVVCPAEATTTSPEGAFVAAHHGGVILRLDGDAGRIRALSAGQLGEDALRLFLRVQRSR